MKKVTKVIIFSVFSVAVMAATFIGASAADGDFISIISGLFSGLPIDVGAALANLIESIKSSVDLIIDFISKLIGVVS